MSLGMAVESSYPEAFYMTCAAVIPLLFIALTLQSPVLTRAASSAGRRQWKAILDGDRATELRYANASVALLAFIFVIVAAGVCGECLAILALKQRRSGAFSDWFVFWSTFVLVVLVAVFYAVEFISAVRRGRAEAAKDLRRPSERTALDKTEAGAESTAAQPARPPGRVGRFVLRVYGGGRR